MIGFISPTLTSKFPMQSAMNLYNVMKDDPRFFTVRVGDQTYYTNKAKTSHALVITLWYKGKLGEDEKKEFINSIVKTVFENEKNIDKYDELQIKFYFCL